MNNEAPGAVLEPSGDPLGRLGVDAWRNGRSLKRTTLRHLWWFFGVWGLLWRVLEAVLGGFWELCWKMLAPRWCFFGYLGRCCGILVPRWRTGAPRRGKIGELRRRGLLQGGSNPRGDTRWSPLHPPKNGFSRMGLQTPTPTGTGSGKLEDWRTGRLENWKTGELVTGPSALHCTRNCA